MKSVKKIIKKLIFSLIGAVVITTALSFDILQPTANRITDEFYQTHESPNPEIIIIGMDEKAENTYGSMPWPRDIMAKAINELNKNPDKKPAVIGIDTLYTSEGDEDLDNSLVEAIKNGGNVVTATNITFGNELVTLNDGSFYMNDYAVVLVEEPFLELKEASLATGHLNAMLDDDGILRHAIWNVTLENEEEYPSFNQVIYKAYMDYKNLEAITKPPSDSRDRWYLDFTSYPGSYDDGYSIVDLVEGKLDEDLFKDKIVLIGPYALGMSDEYFTSIDHATKMFGVEYQANAIAALINEDLKYEVLDNMQSAILLVLTFITLYVFYEKKLVRVSVYWIVFTGLWVLVCYILWNIGVVINVFYQVVSLLICYILSVLVNYLKSSYEKNKITKAFKRYVAPQVVSRLLENQIEEPKLGGTVTDIAVLFADIRGFTPLSEALSASEVADILNRYLSMMSECVFKYNGTLDKFMGDCVMAFWGAPFTDEDIAKKAVLASIDMVLKSNELEKELKDKYGHTINIGIGINYGTAVVGNFGSKDRMDYTAIGDTVNIASRLESNAKAGSILISENVKNLIDDEIKYSKLEEDITLKGKTKKIEIYKIDY